MLRWARNNILHIDLHVCVQPIVYNIWRNEFVCLTFQFEKQSYKYIRKYRTVDIDDI